MPLVRDDGTTAAFTIPEFVSEPRVTSGRLHASSSRRVSVGRTDRESAVDPRADHRGRTRSTGPAAERAPVETPTHAHPLDGGGVESVDERTSPFPYADNFDEWVAGETGAPEDRASPPPAKTGRGAETERRGDNDESGRRSHP